MAVSRRHAARERALGLLYEAEMKAVAPAAVLSDLVIGPDEYAAALVAGVARRQPEIDALVGEAAEGWAFDRLAAIDRNVLRIACLELLEHDDVPTAVVLDEAVELAKTYSTEESGRFVNGVLATIATRLRP